MQAVYHFLDIFFVCFHSLLVIFNIFGWIWKKTRIINLITLLITGLSWSLLGWIVGTPGYCPLTDWHFTILEKLGRSDLPVSYIKYLADRIGGININPDLVDDVTLFTFIAALMFSIFFNTRDLVKRKKGPVSS
jgi:hypothetical protein